MTIPINHVFEALGNKMKVADVLINYQELDFVLRKEMQYM